MADTSTQTARGIHLFEGLDGAAVKRIDQNCAWKHYPKGEQIIDKQSESRDVFVVAAGRVRVVNYSFAGREITLDDLEEGSYFGELAAIDSQPRSASVMALTDCMLGALTHDFFLSLCRENNSVAFGVMTSLTRMVRVATDRIMDLSTLAANNRVQAELLRQARSCMTDAGRAEIKPIPVHGDIASRVSTTRETVARVMNDLARRGVVERSKDTLVVKAVDRLEEMVEEVRGE